MDEQNGRNAKKNASGEVAPRATRRTFTRAYKLAIAKNTAITFRVKGMSNKSTLQVYSRYVPPDTPSKSLPLEVSNATPWTLASTLSSRPFAYQSFSDSYSILPLKSLTIPSSDAELSQGALQIRVVDPSTGRFAIATMAFGS